MIDAFRGHGGTRVVLRKDALVLADGDNARRIAGDLVAAGYRGMSMASLIVGSADDAAQQLDRYRQAGFEEFSIRCMSVPQELALETLAQLGTIG